MAAPPHPKAEADPDSKFRFQSQMTPGAAMHEEN